MSTLVINRNSYKIGVEEIQGLPETLGHILAPVTLHLRERAYWDDRLAPELTEYKSRDGFMAYSENLGGMQLSVIVPSCERYDWDFLEFGECEECGQDTKDGEPQQCGYSGQECASESDGHLDARLRIWLKLERLDDGTMHFYLYAGGGNGDAPYFRVKYETTLFEAEFKAKSLAGIKLAARPHIQALMKVLGAA